MRNNSEFLDSILNFEFSVLDKGFIRVIDYMGNDKSIVQSARVSYGDGTKTVRDDQKLIDYLMKNAHTSPFEMCEIKFHIKCPIFVARQWLRHRTASVNEISGRYSEIKTEYFIPDQLVIRKQSKKNKQCSDEYLSIEESKNAVIEIDEQSYSCFQKYNNLLKKEISREMSRIILPLNTYTEFYWKIDLHNLLHFIKLRDHEHAQPEIREYARVIKEIIKKWCPITHEAFENHVIKSKKISGDDISFLRKCIENKSNDEIFEKLKSILG